MERVDGPDLQEFILKQPNSKLAEGVARIFHRNLLAALRHAHALGWLHCDLKPQNVRLNAECNKAVLVDWGFAREIERQPAPITQGTPRYVSPEPNPYPPNPPTPYPPPLTTPTP